MGEALGTGKAEEMKRLFLIPLAWMLSVQAQDLPCECPKLGCDPCSIRRGVSFYTEKCGPQNSKVKSCDKPTCIPLEEPTEACPNPPKGTAAREPVIIKSSLIDAHEDISRADVGRVRVIRGSVAIVHSDGKKEVIHQPAVLRETDAVESSSESTALIEFQGGNKIHVHPETTVEVQEFKDQDQSASRKALINLIKGKVRNQVLQKYNGTTSSYRVITKGAVAGVRGTDFIVEYHEGDKLETRVETLEGKVSLSGRAGEDAREIARGEGATYTADAKDNNGSLSPVYRIPAQKLRDLEIDSRVDVARAKIQKPALPEKDICDKPKGKFNQCKWVCVSDAGKKKECGKCMRTRCNANGEWAEETELPENSCSRTGTLTKPCDY